MNIKFYLEWDGKREGLTMDEMLITSHNLHHLGRDHTVVLEHDGVEIDRSEYKYGLDELAESQHVHQLADIRAIFGTWPGDDDDGFEEAINELRHSGSTGGDV